jgi:hypothetical protein
MPAESRYSVAATWLEPIALLGASSRARGVSDEMRARMKPWVIAASARYRVARELRDLETQSVALGLLREAAFFALCGLEATDPATVVARSSKEAWQRFDALPSKPAGAPEQLALVRDAFGNDDALAMDLVLPSEANDLRLAAEACVAWLLTLVEVRTPAQLARARLVRSALALLGLVVIVWGIVAYCLALTAIEPR